MEGKLVKDLIFSLEFYMLSFNHLLSLSSPYSIYHYCFGIDLFHFSHSLMSYLFPIFCSKLLV
jgi:hypothetical protein